MGTGGSNYLAFTDKKRSYIDFHRHTLVIQCKGSHSSEEVGGVQDWRNMKEMDQVARGQRSSQ